MPEWGKGAELLELETVQRAIDESATWAGQEMTRRIRGFQRVMLAGRSMKIESPIEAAFWAWFSAVATLDYGEVYQFDLEPQEEFVSSAGTKYRFDFTVQFGPNDTQHKAFEKGIAQPKIAIELDGHDFHERTKAQVAARNERDRYAQADGWTILHFSGSELYRDPLKCVMSVMDICRSRHDEWSKAVWYSSPSQGKPGI